jgi:hypothetical protein
MLLFSGLYTWVMLKKKYITMYMGNNGSSEPIFFINFFVVLFKHSIKSTFYIDKAIFYKRLTYADLQTNLKKNVQIKRFFLFKKAFRKFWNEFYFSTYSLRNLLNRTKICIVENSLLFSHVVNIFNILKLKKKSI